MPRCALWTACLPLVIAGCAALPRRHAAGRVAEPALSPREQARAEALASYGRGLLFEESPGNFDRAVEAFRRAAERDPRQEVLPLKVAAAYLARRDPTNAIEVLEQTRQRHPRSAQVHLLLGLAYQAAERGGAAERAYRRGIRLAPRQSGGYVRLSALHLARNRPERACRVLRGGLARVKDPAELLSLLGNLGRLHLMNGQTDLAVRCFEPVVKRQPTDWELKELLARAYARQKRRSAAIALLLDIAANRPDNRQAEYYLGELYEDAGDLARAAEHFGRAAQGTPPQVAPFLRLAYVYLRTDPAKAAATLQEALRLLPDDPTIHTYLGLLHSGAGRYDEAVREFERAERTAPAGADGKPALHAQFYYWFGSACERAGRLERAEALLERCLALNPDSHEALNYLAYTWADRGVQLDRAAEYIARALRLAPNDAAYLDTLGWIHFRRGEFAEALKHLRRAHGLLPADATIADHVGDALHALGRTREAVPYWEKTLRANPRNRAAADKLRAAGADVDALLRDVKGAGPPEGPDAERARE
jgi:tetratricopeptide (TPR) repeat protein